MRKIEIVVKVAARAVEDEGFSMQSGSVLVRIQIPVEVFEDAIEIENHLANAIAKQCFMHPEFVAALAELKTCPIDTKGS